MNPTRRIALSLRKVITFSETLLESQVRLETGVFAGELCSCSVVDFLDTHLLSASTLLRRLVGVQEAEWVAGNVTKSEDFALILMMFSKSCCTNLFN